MLWPKLCLHRVGGCWLQRFHMLTCFLGQPCSVALSLHLQLQLFKQGCYLAGCSQKAGRSECGRRGNPAWLDSHYGPEGGRESLPRRNRAVAAVQRELYRL